MFVCYHVVMNFKSSDQENIQLNDVARIHILDASVVCDASDDALRIYFFTICLLVHSEHITVLQIIGAHWI